MLSLTKKNFVWGRFYCDVVTSYLALDNEVKPSKLVKDQAWDIEIICTIAETPGKISIFFFDGTCGMQTGSLENPTSQFLFNINNNYLLNTWLCNWRLGYILAIILCEFWKLFQKHVGNLGLKNNWNKY